MALASRIVTEWLGDPGAIVDYSARFTRPVIVPDTEDGALIELSGTIGAVNDNDTVRVDITARFEGKTVLGKCTATVRLP